MNDESNTGDPARWPVRMGGCFRVGVATLAGCVLAWVTFLPYVFVRPPKSAVGWLLLLLITVPTCFAADFLGEKLSSSWGERHPLLKLLKALMFVFTGFIIVVVAATCSSNNAH